MPKKKKNNLKPILPKEVAEDEVIKEDVVEIVKLDKPSWLNQDVWNNLTDIRKKKICEGLSLEQVLNNF